MHCVKKITEDLYWVGGNDRRLNLFENVYPIPNGISYNAYLLLDEKTVLFDTVDKSVSGLFFENLAHLLDGRRLDFLIVNHMEPDHCATMNELVLRYPEVCIICNAKTLAMIKQFFSFDIDGRVLLIKEMDTLCSGRHTFTFLMAPMVHWPEAMVTYDTTEQILYSADAFGTFGAVDGIIFADELRFESDWLDEARRYYTNIVGKYGTQVQALLKKAAGVEIRMICPLHGPVWRKNIHWFIEKYLYWSSYTPEEEGVLIAYASIYGHTENAAAIAASRLAEQGITNIKMYDVSVTHPSYILADAFRYSHILLASATYNAGIFPPMETLVHDLVAHNLQNRTVAVIENGTWAATAGKLIKDELAKCKNLTVLENTLSLKSAMKPEQSDDLDALISAIHSTLHRPDEIAPDQSKIEPNAMFTLSYGLFVLTAKDEKDNGCIINTVMQITDSPKRITIGINKTNLTHDMVLKTGKFNISVLSTDAPFTLFQRFGFQSGRDADKFDGFTALARSENGLYYLTDFANAFLSAAVTETVDCGTHTLFIADVTEAKVISHTPSVTYQYYFDNIKPKPQPASEVKKGFVCKVCGYVYEGESLPPDFICPLCKHGAEDFEPLQ